MSGFCFSSECDVFFGFGDGNKYVTILSAMKGAGGVWIYPSCESNSLPSGDIIRIFNSSLSPRDVLAGGNRSNWDLWSDKVDGTWPIKIEITNDYRTNEVIIAFSHVYGYRSASCLFGDVFTANTDLHFTIRSDPLVDAGMAIHYIDIFKNVSKVTAADNDPLVEIATSTSTISNISIPYWFLNNSKATEPPAWYV